VLGDTGLVVMGFRAEAAIPHKPDPTDRPAVGQNRLSHRLLERREGLAICVAEQQFRLLARKAV
jgi:hypothetical protein